MKYDYVKGYKGPMDSLPKEIREIVEDRMLSDGTLTKEELDNLILEVDLYVEIDIKNFYKRSD
jgi:hypothetical protein